MHTLNSAKFIMFRVPTYSACNLISSFLYVHSNAMDKSWMTKPRISDEYIDGCKSFVDFAIRNCKTSDGLIHCPCKTCRINRRHPPGLVYEHLTRGKGMWPQYKDWIYLGVQPVRAPIEGSNLT
jgi:hypothetical protein